MATYRERVERKDDHGRTLSATFCGHKSNRLVLMNNWNKVKEAESIATDSAGLSVQRYQTYMEGLEASTNKFKATWEEMWMKTFDSEVVKGVINMGTAILKLVGDIGLLNIVAVALFSYFGTKLLWIIPEVSAAMYYLATSMGVAATTATTLSYALTGGLIGIAVVGSIAAFNALNQTMVETYNNFEKLKSQTDENISELNNLAEEYEKLANKENKSAEDKTRLLDIQSILNTRYDAAISGINLYTDAVDGNSVAIQENIEWIKKQAEEQAKTFVASNEGKYKEAQDLLSGKNFEGKSDQFGNALNINSVEDQIKWLDKQIALGNDIFGIQRKTRDSLLEQVAAAQKLVIEYERYLHILNGTDAEKFTAIGEYQRDQFVDVSDSVIQLTASLDELQKKLDEQTLSATSANREMESLIESYDELGELSMEQVQSMEKAFGQEYINALYVEGNQIKLNKEALKELVLAKIDDAIVTARQAAEVGGHTAALEKNVQILVAYRNQVASGSALNKNSVKEQRAAYEELLKDTISMIKQRVNAEKDALQEELRAFKDAMDEKKKAIEDAANDQKERLQDELDGYKQIIDAEKRRIQQLKDSQDQADAVSQKNKEISDIDNELLAIQFDNSEEANKRRLELEADRADKVKELNDIQNEYSVKNQLDALDQEYNQFERANKLKQRQIEDTTKMQIDALDREYKAYELQINNKIKALQDYLNNTGKITEDAMNLIKGRTKSFYDDLLAWNKKFGTSVDEDIIKKWNAALGVIQNYMRVASMASAYGSLSTSQQNSANGLRISGAGMTEEMKEKLRAFGFTVYHNGGIVGGKEVGKNEEFAKLVKGEVVVTPSQATNFVKNTLPSIANNNMGDINVPIYIEGSVDKEVLRDLKDTITTTINDVMKARGIRRGAFSFSQ